MDNFNPAELISKWLIGLAVSVIFAGAKITTMLFGRWEAQPSDPEAYAIWARRRKWIIISELGAVGAYPTFSLFVGMVRGWDVALIGLMCAVLCMFGYNRMAALAFRLSEISKLGIQVDAKGDSK